MKIEFVKDNSPESTFDVTYFTRVNGKKLKGSEYGRTPEFAKRHFDRFVKECGGREYEVLETVYVPESKKFIDY